MNEFFTNVGLISVVAFLSLFTPLAHLSAFLFVAAFPLAAFQTILAHSKRLEELQSKSTRDSAMGNSEAQDSAITETARLNINTAGESEIANLPTIGPILAKPIVKERNLRPFASLDDLQRRCGLKPHQVERLRPILTFQRTAVRDKHVPESPEKKGREVDF